MHSLHVTHATEDVAKSSRPLLVFVTLLLLFYNKYIMFIVAYRPVLILLLTRARVCVCVRALAPDEQYV
jgi:hypothetical protein